MNGPHVVTDPGDPRVEVFRDVRDRDLRGRDGLFMAESELVLRRLLSTLVIPSASSSVQSSMSRKCPRAASR